MLVFVFKSFLNLLANKMLAENQKTYHRYLWSIPKNVSARYEKEISINFFSCWLCAPTCSILLYVVKDFTHFGAIALMCSKIIQVIFIINTLELFSEQKRLTSLDFVGPTRMNLVIDPLAVKHIDNRLYQLLAVVLLGD